MLCAIYGGFRGKRARLVRNCFPSEEAAAQADQEYVMFGVMVWVTDCNVSQLVSNM